MKKQQGAFLTPTTTTSLLFASLFFLLSLRTGALAELRDSELDKKDGDVEELQQDQDARIAAARHDAMRARSDKQGSETVAVLEEEDNASETETQQREDLAKEKIAAIIVDALKRCGEEMSKQMGAKVKLQDYQELKDFVRLTHCSRLLAPSLHWANFLRVLLKERGGAQDAVTAAVDSLITKIKEIIPLRETFLEACRDKNQEKANKLALQLRENEKALWKSISEQSGLSLEAVERIIGIPIFKKVTFSLPADTLDQKTLASRKREPSLQRSSSEKYEYIPPARRGLPGGW